MAANAEVLPWPKIFTIFVMRHWWGKVELLMLYCTVRLWNSCVTGRLELEQILEGLLYEYRKGTLWRGL